MLRKLAICAALLAVLSLASGTPVLAQSAFYVPAEFENPLDETWILLTNTGNKGAKVTLRFIGQRVDGTNGEDEGMEVTVPAGQTKVIRNAAPPGGVGLIEVVSSGEIRVSTRLAKQGGLIRDLPTDRPPVITTENAAAANGTLDLVGLQREVTGSTITDVRLVNLGHGEANCTAQVFRADGAQLWGTFHFDKVTPLSVITFDDALLALNEVDGVNVRIRFSCSDRFYAFATLVDPVSQRLVFVTPADSVLELGLGIPGGDGGGGNLNCAPGTTLCYQIPGLAFRAVKGNETTGRVFPVPAGTYEKIHVQFTLKNGGWSPRGSQLRYMIIWLGKDGKNRDMVGFSFVEGPNRNQATLRHGFNSEHSDKLKVSDRLEWPEGATYLVDYVYDTVSRSIVHEVRRLDGTVLSRIVSKPDINRIRWDKAGNITAGFGNEDKNLAGKEPFQIGWEWRDFLLEIW